MKFSHDALWDYRRIVCKHNWWLYLMDFCCSWALTWHACVIDYVIIADMVFWICKQVFPGLDSKQFVSVFETWRKLAFGQIASSVQLYHSKRCSTGDFSLLEIFFCFRSLIALSGQFFLMIKKGGVMLVTSETGVGTLAHLYP